MKTLQRMDKLKLFFPNKEAMPRHIMKQHFTCTGASEVRPGVRVYYYNDREAGVKITDTTNGLTIETNPTRFIEGHNYTMIDRKGLEHFTTAFSNRYKTDFSLWHVSLFDFNSNITLSHPPGLYLANFGGLKTWVKTEYMQTGINYHTRSKTKALTCYDLNERCKQNKEPIPQDAPHTLRIELSINRQPNKQKELRDMQTLHDYTQPANYVRFPAIWHNTFNQITRNEAVVYIPGLTKREADMVAAIELHTLNGYRNKLKIDYPKNYRYHYSKIEELIEKIKEHQPTTLFDELSQKVEDRAKQLIATAMQAPRKRGAEMRAGAIQ